MSTNNLSTWLTEDIDVKSIAETDSSNNGGISLLSTDSAYTESTYGDYGNSYSDYSDGSYTETIYSKTGEYVVYREYNDGYDNVYIPPPLPGYDDYYDYSRYHDYYNYSNYTNTASITANPISQCIELGNQVTFSIVVSNSSVVTSYQWYKASTETDSGSPINGATSSS